MQKIQDGNCVEDGRALLVQLGPFNVFGANTASRMPQRLTWPQRTSAHQYRGRYGRYGLAVEPRGNPSVSAAT